MTNLAQPGADASAERWVLRHFYWLIAAIAAIRLLQGAFTQLAPDEAVYWMWSRHLSPGYLDHPPMIAVLNWLSTRLLGDREIAVRAPAVLLATATLFIIVRMARSILRDELAVAIVATVWVCAPMLAGFGLIFTPDTPALFFSTAALAFALIVASRMDQEKAPPDQTPRLPVPWAPRPTSALFPWIGLGICIGLGLDSKYPVVLLPAAIAASLLCSRRGRRELTRPGPWIAALLALGFFAPVIYWNATHHWASFLFQLAHGTSGKATPSPPRNLLSFITFLLRLLRSLFQFLAGQALLWTPILFGLSAIVLWKYWRAIHHLGELDRMLLFAGSAPLLLFGAAALKAGRGEINWPAFAYVPISLLLARWVAQSPATRLGWMRAGWQVALGFTLVLQIISSPVMLPSLLRIGMPLPHAVADLTGWHTWAGALAKSANGALIVCNRHQDASEATFYLPGQPDVWCDSIGTRPAAYDYFADRPDFARINRLLYVGGNLQLFMAKYGYTHAEKRNLDLPPGGDKTRSASMISR